MNARATLNGSGKDKTPLVAITGGANGIGAACAQLARAAGWRVAILDRDAEAGETLAGTLDATFHRLDLLACDDLQPLCEAVETSAGPVDAVLNSAGISQPTSPPSALPLDIWDQVMRTHLRGSYLVCRAFGSAMAARGHGSIVNIASIAGMRSVPLHAYGPAKAAIISMTTCLAAEWGRSGVRANCVSPGFTRTARVERRFASGERDADAYSDSALGRMVEPDEVARACLFLLSDNASGITGVNLPVDCGWLVSGPWQAFGGLRAAHAPIPESGR